MLMQPITVIIDSILKRRSYEEIPASDHRQDSRQPSPFLLSQQVLSQRPMPSDMLTLRPYSLLALL